MKILEADGLSFSYGKTMVLDQIRFSLDEGSFAALIGFNGAGKSTLIRLLLGELTPNSGSIRLMGQEISRFKGWSKIGYVPQSVNIEKNTPVSVYDLIASYQYNYPVFLPKSKKIEAKIRETLEVFEAEELIDKQVCNLSGGQLQRVLLSMAIMDEPNLLLLDEPVSGIDQNGMELFYKTMDYLKTHYDLAIILISHDLDYVAKYADHVVLLDKTVAKQGTVKEVFESREFERIFYTGEESWVREEEHK